MSSGSNSAFDPNASSPEGRAIELPGIDGEFVEQVDDLVPALDVSASLALGVRPEDWTLLAHSGDTERRQVAVEMLDDFIALDELTGWSRVAMASLIGCKHPEPAAWLEVDLSELMHSRTVVGFIREMATAGAESDPTIRIDSLQLLVPELTHDDARLIASREVTRSMIRLCTDLLRRARGSTFAVRRAMDDGEILDFIVNDSPGDALRLGAERLAPRARFVAQLETNIGNLALVTVDEAEPAAETVEQLRAQIRSGLSAAE